ncbi:MAG: fumarate reductase/succinate dehydrogenase flavoprotein subunit [Candidatus Obscuribacterales bacterium]
MANYETHVYDVLVVGAGGAGLRAAIEASSKGANVGLVCKSLLGKAHTVMAEGGIAAAIATVDERDGWETHFRDTMIGGKYLNNWRMAQIHAQEAPECVYELEQWGAVFDRTKDGKILQRAFGGHTYKRLCHVGDRTGLEMIRTLQDRGVHQGIAVHMEHTISRLFKDGDRISGALGYNRENGNYVLFKAKAVVLATGGVGRAFPVTSNSWEYTADGHALAYDAGADLIDMEFVQFHPTGMVWPPGVKGILVTEAVRGEGGKLTNSEGKRFMWEYLPPQLVGDYSKDTAEADAWLQDTLNGILKSEYKRPPELSTRDNVARAIYEEVRAGRGSPHGGVFLDISYQPAERVKAKLPSMYHQFKDLADVDITATPMEVGPTMHYIMGGIRVNADTGESRVPGLFAAGECSGGMHGANRLGGNSLSDLIVFGRRAGRGSADYATKLSAAPQVSDEDVKNAIAEMEAPFNRTGENPYQLQKELNAIMDTHVGIFREEKELEEGIKKLEALKEKTKNVSIRGGKVYNPGWHLCRDMHNMLIASEAIARSALSRKESRGAHSRTDFTKTDESLSGENTAISRNADGSMKLEKTPKPEIPEDLKKLFEKKEPAHA